MHEQQFQEQISKSSVQGYQKTMHAFTAAQFERQASPAGRGKQSATVLTEVISPLSLTFDRLQLKEGKLDSPTLGSEQVVIETNARAGKAIHPPRSVGTRAGRGASLREPELRSRIWSD
jgi:hypothetical protein